MRSNYARDEEPSRASGVHGSYEIVCREASAKLKNGIRSYYNISRVHRYARAGAATP